MYDVEYIHCIAAVILLKIEQKIVYTLREEISLFFIFIICFCFCKIDEPRN